MFLLLNALYTNEEKHFGEHSFCVAKSNANRNSHVLLKYLRFTNSFFFFFFFFLNHQMQDSIEQTGYHYPERETDSQTETERDRETDRDRETGRETETERNRDDRQRHRESERHTGLSR